MPVSALPDIAGAVNARLRSLSALTALTSTRISTARQSSWSLPSRAVLIEAGKGGGEDTPGLLWERIDVRCYGAGDDPGTRARDAHLVWRTLHYWFCPAIGSGRPSGFFATASGASVSVLKVALDGGPLRLSEPDENWQFTFASYRLTYNAEPAA